MCGNLHKLHLSMKYGPEKNTKANMKKKHTIYVH